MKLNIIIPLFLVFLFSLLTWFNTIFIFPLCITSILAPTFYLIALSKDKRLTKIETDLKTTTEALRPTKETIGQNLKYKKEGLEPLTPIQQQPKAYGEPTPQQSAQLTTWIDKALTAGCTSRDAVVSYVAKCAESTAQAVQHPPVSMPDLEPRAEIAPEP